MRERERKREKERKREWFGEHLLHPTLCVKSFGVEQQLRDLRRALQRRAAAVMWRDGVPVPQVVKGTLETMTERTQLVDVTVPQTMEELQERISERMYEQTVDQPGDQK